MKIKHTVFIIFVFAFLKLNGQNADVSLVNTLLESYSEKAYSTESVAEDQLELILQCGMKAPSAFNKQPWKFTVIRDEAFMREIVPEVTPGNVLILVSGLESAGGIAPDLDCGLASENMFIAAHALGLGSRIYINPIEKINADRGHFQIPAGYKVVIVLRIGNTNKSIDAVSAATTRKSPEEVINYLK